MNYGTVFNIQRMSIHDGPGIRTTVFLKGCPLRCAWCHNPESQSPEPEPAYHANRCVGCGFCVAQCPAGALSLSAGKVKKNTDLCIQCNACVASCPYSAWECYGERMSVEDVVTEVLKDKAYYTKTGGGVTFSGGEPLLRADFVAACATQLREHGVHVAVETACFGSETALRRLFDAADLFLVDLKVMDDAAHRRWIGSPVEPILQNLRLLGAWGAEALVRIPVVMGCNATEENMAATADFLLSQTPYRTVELLKMHKLAENKYRALRRDWLIADVEPPTEEHMAELANVLKQKGLCVYYKGEIV